MDDLQEEFCENVLHNFTINSWGKDALSLLRNAEEEASKKKPDEDFSMKISKVREHSMELEFLLGGDELLTISMTMLRDSDLLSYNDGLLEELIETTKLKGEDALDFLRKMKLHLEINII